MFETRSRPRTEVVPKLGGSWKRTGPRWGRSRSQRAQKRAQEEAKKSSTLRRFLWVYIREALTIYSKLGRTAAALQRPPREGGQQRPASARTGAI